MRTKSFGLLAALFFLSSSLIFGQAKIEVEGVIRGNDGETLPGASILISGTNEGTITDIDGSFKIQASEDAILIASFIGFEKKEVLVNGQSKMDITLKYDLQQLEEIVVVGYGEQKKETLVSSVSTVAGKELLKSPQPNLSNSFAGRLSGVIATTSSGEPGFDGSNILIRGIGSNGNNNPLIVVDGVASQLGGLERLDPNDIESISVLKDASASIYGSRAANGVILVTTKKGESGKPEFTFSYNQGFVEPTRIPDMANSAEYGQILNEIAYYNNPNGGFNQTYSAEEIALFQNGTDPVNYPNTDWLDELIAPLTFQNQQSLSVKGGNTNMNYFIAAGRRNQESIYENGITEFQQINLRTKFEATLFDDLKIGANMNIREEDAIYPTTSAQDIFRAAYRAKPNLTPFYDGVGYGPGAEGPNNPLLMVTDIPGTDEQPKVTFNTLLNFEYNLPFADYLTIKGFYSRDQIFKNRKRFDLPYEVYEPVPGSDPIEYAPRPNNIPSPQLFVAKDEEQLTTSHIALHFAKLFGKHYVTAFAAFEQSSYRSNYLHGSRRAFLSSAVDELDQGPEGIDENGNPFGTNAGGSFEEARRNYFGRVTYDYEGKYLMEAQLRYDGSSKFAEENQYGLFWSSSVGWRVSEESFFNVPQINNLKLRASYGVLGNDRIPDFQFLNRYQNIGAGYVVDGLPVTRYVIAQIANRGITWEESKKVDFGLETTLFKNFTIEVDYFAERREGLLIEPRDIPWVSGIINEWDATNSSNDNVPAIIPQQNIGIVENQGWEGQVSYSQRFGAFKVFASANATYAKSEVIDIRDPETLEWKKQEGKPLFAGLNYEAIGLFRTQEDLDTYPSLPNNQVGDLIYRDVDGDGEITANDQVRADFTNIPQLFYGATIGFNWKGIDFSMLLQGQDRVQQYFLPEAGTIGNFTQTWTENRYSPTNLGGTFPRVDTRTSSSVNGGNEFRTDFWLVDTRFLRIRNVELGYNLPETLINKIGFKAARIYVNGLNLATFTSSDDFDPEVNNIQGQAYPQHKIYNIGATLKF